VEICVSYNSMSISQAVTPELQKRYIENNKNTAFLPTLEFIPLRLSFLKKKFVLNTDNESKLLRLNLVKQLYTFSCLMNCNFFKGDKRCENDKDYYEGYNVNTNENANGNTDENTPHQKNKDVSLENIKLNIPRYSPENYPDSDDYVQLFCERSTEYVNITPYIAYITYEEDEKQKAFVAGYIELHISKGPLTFGVYTGNVSSIALNTQSNNIYGAFAYIYYTCSFTTLNEHYDAIFAKLLANNPGKKLSIGSYLLYNAMRVFKKQCDIYIKKHPKVIPSKTLDLYVLWSYALEDARAAHRKVGKRSACTFLHQWRALNSTTHYIDDTSVVKQHSNFGPNTMIYTYPPLVAGEPIYEALMNRGANLNVMNNKASNVLSNASYRCLSGASIMNYSKYHAPSNSKIPPSAGNTNGGTRRRKSVTHLAKSRRRRHKRIQVTK